MLNTKKLLFSGNLLREEIFVNWAIFLSEEIIATFDFNYLAIFAIFNLQWAMLDTIQIILI